jgi:hypothetical protein
LAINPAFIMSLEACKASCVPGTCTAWEYEPISKSCKTFTDPSKLIGKKDESGTVIGDTSCLIQNTETNV